MEKKNDQQATWYLAEQVVVVEIVVKLKLRQITALG